MPWNECARIDERLAFVEAYLTQLYAMSELCRSAGVSRPTGYLWIERYRQHGESGLSERLPELTYPGHFEWRRVTHQGDLRWKGRRLFLSSVFAHDLLGLEEIEDRVWSVYLARQLLARLDEHLWRLIEVPV